jgi:hypothetical protein
MPTCPLCENVQPGGEECDVCGRPFPRGEGVPVPVAPLPELERTAIEIPPGAAASAEPPGTLEALEPTAAPDAGAVAVAAVEGLELTRAAPVGVEAVTLPDLEPTGEAPIPDLPVPDGAGTTCRYCRTPAMPGQSFCARCGMRLPSGDMGREAAPAGPPGTCWQCGSPVARETCPSCGARARD